MQYRPSEFFRGGSILLPTSVLSIYEIIKKIMLGTSDTWSTSHLSQQTSRPVYYNLDCQTLYAIGSIIAFLILQNLFGN